MKYATVLLIAWATLTIVGAARSNADPGKINKLRSFYRDNGMDFFGDLIADQSDVMSDEKRRAKLELLADDARTKALDQLEKLLKTSRGAMQAELLIRKASLSADRARTATYFQNNPFKASKLKTPGFYLDQSIKTFMQVERLHPSHPKMDVVVFSVGYNFGELRQFDDAFKYYGRLVSRFASSPLVGDARLAMAEILFEKRKFGEALVQLREIVKEEHPRLKNFALYKMAWAYYNMSDLASATLSLEKVIEGVNQAQGLQRARLELRKEALQDLVTFYAENPERSPAQAGEYFEQVAKTPSAIAADVAEARARRLAALIEKKAAIPDEETDAYQLTEAQELLFRLTQLYRDQGKHQNAMTSAEALLRSLPRHPRAVALYRLRAESAEKLRRRDLVLVELERLAKVVESDLSPAQSDDLPSDQIDSVVEYFARLTVRGQGGGSFKIEPARRPLARPANADDLYRRNLARVALETLKDFTNFLHGEWMKTGARETALSAAAAYDLAVRALLAPWRGHDLRECYELRYRRAQLRYALKQWDAAASDYAWLAPRYGESREDILRGEIASLESLLKESPIKTVSGTLHPFHERLLQAYDRFLAYLMLEKGADAAIGDDKHRQTSAGILAASARLLGEYGEASKEQALKRMIAYATRFHDGKDAVALARDVLVSLEKSARWEHLRDFAETLIDARHYKALALAKDLSKAREFAHLKLLEQLEKDQNWKKAAGEFADFAAKHPDSPYASQAIMKSANAALQLKDDELSVKRLEAATNVTDEAVRLQAWLALEPFYRKAYQWKRLTALYGALLGFKSDAKTREGAKKNLEALANLEAAAFEAQGAKLLSHHDADLEQAIARQAAFERGIKEFNAVRFVKSNNNPAANFKRKTDLHAKLAAAADKIVDATPKSLRGSTQLWVGIVKAELLIELAETLETAALPAMLKGAPEADRKAYVDTIIGQTKGLREKAIELTDDSARLVVKVDSPSLVEERLNSLLKRVGDQRRFKRASFVEFWEKRPKTSVESQSSDFDERVATLGFKILNQQDGAAKARESAYELAALYAQHGQSGYAQAVAVQLIAEKTDESSARASRLLITLDFDRLPAAVAKAAATDGLTPQTRWDLARWIASQGEKAKRAPGAFSEDEMKWFEEALSALLKPILGEQAALEKTSLSRR